MPDRTSRSPMIAPFAVASLALAGCARSTPPPGPPPGTPEPVPAPVLAPAPGSAPAPPAEPALGDGHRVVDLTHPMHEKMPFWPGGVPFKKVRLADYDKGYRFHRFEVGENTGTHVDAPAHFIEGQADIDDIALEDLVVPAVVIDVKEKVAKDSDYAVTAADIATWEKTHGRVSAGTLVIVNTGWHGRFADAKEYVNRDPDGVMHFPGYSAEAARVLVERDVAGIGIDTLSIDPGPSKDFAAHKVMLTAGKYQVENLANLDVLPPAGATVVVGVLPVAEGSQAQARVLALIPR